MLNPGELLDIWRKYGFGSFMGGYLKVINPGDYQDLLKETYFRGTVSIPILITAFADIITLEEDGYIGIVSIKTGNFLLFHETLKGLRII